MSKKLQPSNDANGQGSNHFYPRLTQQFRDPNNLHLWPAHTNLPNWYVYYRERAKKIQLPSLYSKFNHETNISGLDHNHQEMSKKHVLYISGRIRDSHFHFDEYSVIRTLGNKGLLHTRALSQK